MDFFGLDIGSHNLKVVQLKRAGDKYQLIALGSAPSPPKGLASEAESDLTILAEAIKKLHQEAKITTKNVATALPEDQVFTRVITLPKLTDEELTSALKWEAEQYVPIPLTEVTLAHQIIGGASQNKEKIEVLLVAAPKRLIDKLLKVLKTAGLNPVSLETEILAMSRSLAAPDSEGTLLVDLGARATDIAIVEKQQIVFTRSIMTAGEALTRAVASSLGLEIPQAEEYKKAYGVDPGKLEGKVSKAIKPIFEVVIKEMEQAIQFYHSEKKDKVIKRIVLTGGTAILPEIVSLVAKELNIETQIGDPFTQIIKDNLLTKIPEGDLPFYAAAVGLAMKEI
jgi:type IV pilus assembly protein PilM